MTETPQNPLMAFATPQVTRSLGAVALAAGAVGAWLLFRTEASVLGDLLVTLAVADLALLGAAHLFKWREVRKVDQDGVMESPENRPSS